MEELGSKGHQALLAEVVAHYRDDTRVRAVAVFGSTATGRWHELSDVDLDVVIADGVVIDPAAEVAALFGGRAAITLCREDSADVVLESLEEISVRWHPLDVTSPNIAASVRVVGGDLASSELVAAGNINRVEPDIERLLDVLVRDAIGAWKLIQRGRGWDAIVAVQRMRDSLTALRGMRDEFVLDPADPAGALDAVLSEVELGPRRSALIQKTRLPSM